MTTTATVRPTLGVLPLADGSFAVASSDPTHAPYLITVQGAALVCTCKAWQFRQPDSGPCKHGQAVYEYLREQEAERQRAEARWCEACNLVPTTDSLPVCRDCSERSIRGVERAIAAPAIDWAAEQARVAAANARAEVILVGPREIEREVLL
jgi:hypothetical protein